MSKKTKIIIFGALVVFVLDHLTKWLIVQHVSLGQVIPVIPDFFDIVHGRNTGAAFGFLSGWDFEHKNWFFYIIGIVAAIFLYFYAKGIDETDRWSQIAISFVVGGALGNLVDRIMRNSVVDFLSVHIGNEIFRLNAFGYELVLPLTWPAFNVADMGISVAVAILIVQNLRGFPKEGRVKQTEEVL